MSDYKVEADENLKLALTCPDGYQWLRTEDLIGLAQANATLALAEQQHTANLIAYSHELMDNQRDGYEPNDDGKALLNHLEAEIREGLGL